MDTDGKTMYVKRSVAVMCCEKIRWLAVSAGWKMKTAELRKNEWFVLGAERRQGRCVQD